MHRALGSSRAGSEDGRVLPGHRQVENYPTSLVYHVRSMATVLQRLRLLTAVTLSGGAGLSQGRLGPGLGLLSRGGL